MNSPATIVTALYDIGRDKLKGKCAHRAFSKYLDWFKHLLSINSPMVIFIPDDYHSYVLQYRDPEYSTKIVIRKFEELAAYKYHDHIQETIDNMVKEPNVDGKIPNHFRDCPEFITAKYETIIYSKFDFLKEVAADNPYNTEYFIWLDAGTFYQPPPFDVKLPWPDSHKIQILGNKFLVSDYNFDVNNRLPLKDKRSYLRLNKNEICAFMLGGNKSAIDKIHTKFWAEIDNALSMGVINNEQHILQLMVLDNPEDYHIWHRTRINYPSMPIPLRDRMIPSELAIGTFIGENYKTFSDIKLLTISTKEVPYSKYEKWETTAKYYGYNYEILCKDKSWEGFGMKIRMFYERLKSVTEPYVVLTDSNDVFFTGPPEELYDNFIRTGEDIIVGSEMKPHYIKGHHNKSSVTPFFENIKKSEQAFPNSGFIMGKTEHVKRLMEINLDYQDDQAACFDTIYEAKLNLALDYHTILVGNVPNYHNENYKAIEYFTFDEKLRRYKNVYSGETPAVLHFPGGNILPMTDFFANIHPELTIFQRSNSTNSIWVFVGIVIFVIILTIIVYFASR